MLNDKRIKACISRYDNRAYSRMQFLTAVSHSIPWVLTQRLVTNCRLQQQQRRGWNVWGVTSERQRQSRQNRQRHCSIAYVSIKKKTQNTKSPIVACSLLRWWQQCFAVWTNGQFQCKVLLFGGRWSCCLLLDNSVLPSLYPWQVEARKVTIRETTVNRPGRLDCITSISFQAEQV